MASRWMVLAFAIGSLATPVGLRADEAAVRKALAGYADAFNLHNARLVASFWTENGIHRNDSTGEEIAGRAAIETDLANVFKDRPSVHLVIHLGKLRMIRPDVARGEGEATVSGGGSDPSVSRFTVILVASEGKWLIDSVDERPVVSASTADEALAELDWLTGSWLDETSTGKVETTFKRSPSGAFLLRSFVFSNGEGVTDEGHQIIAWDPALKQIRSWTFHADGSFGEGFWSRNGSEWLIRSSQTLVDGRSASGTYVMKMLSDKQLSVQLIGHELAGEPQPTADPVVLTRQPTPAATETPASEKRGDQKKPR